MEPRSMPRHLAACLAGVAALMFCTPARAQNSRTPPPAPGNVQAAADPQAVVTLTWTDQSTDERGFRIVRARQLSASAWGEETGFTVGPNVTSFQDHPAPGTYRYRVRSYNLRGNSSYVAAAPIVVSAASLAPAAPANLVVHDDGNGVAHLTWTDQSNNETGFEIQRQPSFAGASTQSVGPDTPTWLDQTPGGTFAYRVRAINGSGQSGYTPWVRASIMTPLGGNPPPVFPPIIPGHGFTGPTPQPPPVGNPSAPGYDAKAIARWDVVPYQTFTGDFNVGVVAFHMNGIDRVDFSANGGPWVSVHEMKLNPQTNVLEYTARLRAADFADGPVEVRAIAWPELGVPRVLGGVYDVTRSYQGTEWTGEYSLQLFANPDGIAPAQVVELPAGDYTWGEPPLFFGSQPDPSRWLTYRPAAGVPRDQVRIVGGTSQVPTQRNFSKIKVENVTIIGGTEDCKWFNNATDKMIWFDKINVIGPGQWVGGIDVTIPHQWFTDSHISDARSGMATQFVRGCSFERIGEDVIRNHHTVINCTFDGVDSGATTWHSGVLANPYSNDNRIYYGLTIRNLGNSVPWPFRNGTDIHWQNYDIAIVNCNTEGSTQSGVDCWFWGADTRNVYVKDSQFTGVSLWRLTGVPSYWVFQPHTVVFENSRWNYGSNVYPTPISLPGITIR